MIETSGQVKGCDKDFIYIEIVEDDFSDVRNNCERQYFDIFFNINRVSYQLQHKALKYMDHHKLHSLLINNPKYESHDDDVGDSISCSLNSFNGKLAEGLNNEQKMAVKFISKSENMLPYLLFGPAGKFYESFCFCI